jgi:hypothetical protein
MDPIEATPPLPIVRGEPAWGWCFGGTMVLAFVRKVPCEVGTGILIEGSGGAVTCTATELRFVPVR